ncbi:MAG: GNAT family N-acetyltransferase [Burkholderiales bacterium PBB5]|nr:MAG: GNAT family N-acetyltransferase [Burkholderiales bacterium PBB5]
MNQTSTAQLQDAAQRQRYELTLGGQLAGFINYRDTGDARQLVHTEVLPEHEGQGLGTQLAQFALDEARRTGRRVVPSCAFIAAYVKRHPHTADVVSS